MDMSDTCEKCENLPAEGLYDMAGVEASLCLSCASSIATGIPLSLVDMCLIRFALDMLSKRVGDEPDWDPATIQACDSLMQRLG